MEGSPTTIAPLLLRNLLTSLFIYADKCLLNLGERYKLLQLVRCLLVSIFFFFLRILPSIFPSLIPSCEENQNYSFKSFKADENLSALASGGGDVGGGGNSSIARALSQLLSILNDIPVSSRKYEIVRSLADRLIDDNLQDGYEPLREVNCAVLTAAFSRTLTQLEAKAAVMDQEPVSGSSADGGRGAVTDGRWRGHSYYHNVKRVVKAVRYYGELGWTPLGKGKDELSQSGSSAEKMSAELLWLARKLAACRNAEEAMCKWASATKLAWLALSAEPRLQGSLVKISAFLFKQAREMGCDQEVEKSKRKQLSQTKMKLLMSWLPLLCRANNGVEAPVLSINEKAELERVLEEIIETLEQEEEQEKVLSLWLHHFTHCPSSDWPNLHACYSRWCSASRRLLLLH